MSKNKHLRNSTISFIQPIFLVSVFLYYAALQTVNVHIVYMYICNVIN